MEYSIVEFMSRGRFCGNGKLSHGRRMYRYNVGHINDGVYCVPTFGCQDCII